MMHDDDDDVKEMAKFIVAFPGWRPEDYWSLTLKERDALVEAFNKVHGKN